MSASNSGKASAAERKQCKSDIKQWERSRDEVNKKEAERLKNHNSNRVCHNPFNIHKRKQSYRHHLTPLTAEKLAKHPKLQQVLYVDQKLCVQCTKHVNNNDYLRNITAVEDVLKTCEIPSMEDEDSVEEEKPRENKRKRPDDDFEAHSVVSDDLKQAQKLHKLDVLETSFHEISKLTPFKEASDKELNAAVDNVRKSLAEVIDEDISRETIAGYKIKASLFDEMIQKIQVKMKTITKRKEQKQLLTLLPLSTMRPQEVINYFPGIGLTHEHVKEARVSQLEEGILPALKPKVTIYLHMFCIIKMIVKSRPHVGRATCA